jgi:hypothetical protein
LPSRMSDTVTLIFLINKVDIWGFGKRSLLIEYITIMEKDLR